MARCSTGLMPRAHANYLHLHPKKTPSAYMQMAKESPGRFRMGCQRPSSSRTSAAQQRARQIRHYILSHSSGKISTEQVSESSMAFA